MMNNTIYRLLLFSGVFASGDAAGEDDVGTKKLTAPEIYIDATSEGAE